MSQYSSIDPDTRRVQGLVDLALRKPKYTYPTQLNAPKPNPPFASVKKLYEENPGFDKVDISEIGDKCVTTTTGVRIIVFEVLFTEGAEEQSKFISSFFRQDIRDFMVEQDLAVLDHSNTTNDSLKLETNWEIRDGVILSCMVRREYTHEEQIISIAEVSGSVDDVDVVIDIP